MNATTTRSPADRRVAGIAALTAALGRNDAIAFLEEFVSGNNDDGNAGIPGRDYTKWRKEQPEQSDEEIIAGIMNAAQEALDAGWLEGKNVIRC